MYTFIEFIYIYIWHVFRIESIQFFHHYKFLKTPFPFYLISYISLHISQEFPSCIFLSSFTTLPFIYFINSSKQK